MQLYCATCPIGRSSDNCCVSTCWRTTIYRPSLRRSSTRTYRSSPMYLGQKIAASAACDACFNIWSAEGDAMTPQELMTPQERTRRSMLWHKVERLLFCPASAEDQRTWCYCFVRSLARCWEIEDFVVPGSAFPAASFSLPLPDFSLSYDLS